MNRKIFAVCAVLALAMLAGPGPAADKSCDQLMADAEKIWLTGDYDASDKILEQARQICPDRAEIYWRMARDEYDRIENLPRDKKPGKDELIERYRGVEALGDKCIELAPDDGNCYQWKGIGMGRRGTTQGILNSLTEADDLEEIFLKGESLKPSYRSKTGSANSMGDIYTALGQFYRVVPEWLCYFPFKQMFGVCGDIEKSVSYHRKAVALEPKRIEYSKDLAVSLICLGQKKDKPEAIEEGKKILQDIQSWPEIKNSDPIDKQHAKMLLQDPSMACGYSRDAQQEQSQDAYEKDK